MPPPYSGSGMPPFDDEMMDKLIDFSEGKAEVLLKVHKKSRI